MIFFEILFLKMKIKYIKHKINRISAKNEVIRKEILFIDEQLDIMYQKEIELKNILDSVN